METGSEARHAHHRDQAAAALDELRVVDRRAVRASGYPGWFWVLSGVGFAAFPVSTAAGGARDLFALLGGLVILAAVLLAGRGRRVRERCLSLGPRGWAREVALALPVLATVVATVTIAAAATAGWVVAVASLLAAGAWVGYGVLTGRVSGWTR